MVHCTSEMFSLWIFLTNDTFTLSSPTVTGQLSAYLHSQERQSTETRIVLQSVKLNSEGSYLCEVSGEAPLFQTAKNQNFLKVVGNEDWHTGVIMMTIMLQISLMKAPWYQEASPATRLGTGSQPTVHHSTPSQQQGSTGESLILKFPFISEIILKYYLRYINGEEATPAMLVQYPVTEDYRGRLTSVLGLRWGAHFQLTFALKSEINIRYEILLKLRTMSWKCHLL